MTRTEVAEALRHTLHRIRHYETASDEFLARSYAPGKWNARQVINHIADTELAFHWRFCRAVAQEPGAVQPFDENLWSRELEEDRRPVSISFALIEAIRRAMLHYVDTLSDEKLARFVVHPEMGQLSALRIAELLANHALHHLGQLKAIEENRVWSPSEAVKYR